MHVHTYWTKAQTEPSADNDAVIQVFVAKTLIGSVSMAAIFIVVKVFFQGHSFGSVLELWWFYLVTGAAWASFNLFGT